MIGCGAVLLASNALADEAEGRSSMNVGIVRKYFKSWETKDWAPFEAILTDDFTFTSANDDDHISKAMFKTQCWDTQIDFIDRFDIEVVMAQGNAAFVKYLCRTKNGKAFRNVEYHTLRGGRISAIECYFGAKSTFASAVATGTR